MGVGPADAALGRADIGAAGLDQAVDAIRSTISTVENGRRVTYPFDAATARRLYTRLFGPVADRLPTIAHLIFEPDGAMLRLRSEEHTSELQSLMRISYAVFCLKKKKNPKQNHTLVTTHNTTPLRTPNPRIISLESHNSN